MSELLIIVTLDSIERELITLFLDNWKSILDLDEFPESSETRIHIENAIDRLRNKIKPKEAEG